MGIYLDNAATTRVCPEAAQAALEVMTEAFGNPSSGMLSAHRPRSGSAQTGPRWRTPWAACRRSWCSPPAAPRGQLGDPGGRGVRTAEGKHIITTAIEHSAVLEPLRELEGQGYDVTLSAAGPVRTHRYRWAGGALRPDTVLVSMMLVNNELGTILPVRGGGAGHPPRGQPGPPAHRRGPGLSQGALHAGGAGGGSAHHQRTQSPRPEGDRRALYPKGHKAKALAARRRTGERAPARHRAHGAGRRPGRGVQGCGQSTGKTIQIVCRTRKLLLELLEAAIPDAVVVSRGDAPHICAVSLPGYPSEMLVRVERQGDLCVLRVGLPQGKPSHVFAATGRPKRELMGTLRVSFCPDSTREEAKALTEALTEIKNTRIAAGVR